MKAHRDVTRSIGNTPLVHLRKISAETGANIYGKVEGRNPAYSVKCRIGAAMIWDAEERGALKPGGTIVEATSGNTGIALAFASASLGYKLVLTMPETYSIERRKLLMAYGAQLTLTPADGGMPAAVEAAEQIARENPAYFLPRQFENPANPAIHERTTGPEIWRDTDGEIDVLVAGVGTGGTITGISRYIKKTCGKPIETVAIEPSASPVLSGGRAGLTRIQGIGAGFKPKVLDMSLVDSIELVDDDEAFEWARRTTREEGILCGISCGAAIAVAHRLGRRSAYAGKNIVAILPDSGERYLSTNLF